MFHKSDKSSIDELVKVVMEEIKSMHFLGSSNHKIDPTGGLSGYYRNVARRVYASYVNKDQLINPVLYPYLMTAMLLYTGAGNCGEMSGALYTLLHLRELTTDQKKSIELRRYNTKDAHVTNSYVLAGESVFDIWANRVYKKARIKAETHIAEKYHTTILPINPVLTTVQVDAIYKSMYGKFSSEFERELSIDRQTNRMYVTFDSTDPSDFALFANQAFPWLFAKFNETVTNTYFKTHSELASDVQTKILNHFIYLIEELRKEVPKPLSGIDIHPKQRQHSDDEITAELLKLLNNEYVVTWLMAMSYRNSRPELCLHSLEKSLIGLSGVEHNELVSALINLSKQTIMQLAISTPESGPALDKLIDSSITISSRSSITNSALSEHVALGMFGSSSSSVSTEAAASVVPDESKNSDVTLCLSGINL